MSILNDKFNSNTFLSITTSKNGDIKYKFDENDSIEIIEKVLEKVNSQKQQSKFLKSNLDFETLFKKFKDYKKRIEKKSNNYIIDINGSLKYLKFFIDNYEVKDLIEINSQFFNELQRDFFYIPKRFFQSKYKDFSLLRLKQIQESIPKGAFYAGQAKLNEDIRNVTAELKREKLGLKELKQQQKEATTEVKEFNAANKETVKTLGDQIADFKVFGVSLSGIKKGFAGIIPIAKASFATIRAGLISTGIGAFIVAFGLLINYVTQTKRGAEALQRGLTALGAAVDVVRDRLSGLVDGIGLLFSGEFSEGFTKTMLNKTSSKARSTPTHLNEFIDRYNPKP